MMMGAKAAEQKSVNDVISNAYTIAQTEKMQQEMELAPWKLAGSMYGKDKTNDIKNWQFYRQQGGTKGFDDWMLTVKRAGATNIKPGPEATAEKRGIGTAKAKAKTGVLRNDVQKRLEKSFDLDDPYFALSQEEKLGRVKKEMGKEVRAISGWEKAEFKTLRNGIEGWFIPVAGGWELVSNWSE